jgi:hypothetical protein
MNAQLTPEILLNWLNILEGLLNLHIKLDPENHGLREIKFAEIPKEVRDGIVFYSSKRSWRRNTNNLNTLKERRTRCLLNQSVQSVPEIHYQVIKESL